MRLAVLRVVAGKSKDSFSSASDFKLSASRSYLELKEKQE
jgi:hypothetical protein